MLVIFQPGLDLTFLDEIGHGLFGTVLKAEDKNKKQFAVKHITSSVKNKASIEKEIEKLSRDVKDEHVLKISGYSLNVVLGILNIYVVMEKCDCNLHDYMIRSRTEVEQRLDRMVEIAQGVSYLHNFIIHSNLKPENILLKNNGQKMVCKVSDYFISKIKGTTDYNYCGNVAYVAPEILEGNTCTKQSDVFSLGILYFAIYMCEIRNKTVTPVVVNEQKKDVLLNVILRNQHPEESIFIDSYFKKVKGLGELVYSMLHLAPSDRESMSNISEKVKNIRDSYRKQIEMTKIQPLLHPLSLLNDYQNNPHQYDKNIYLPKTPAKRSQPSFIVPKYTNSTRTEEKGEEKKILYQ